ncbi:two-component system nitrogen regulation sensor histidine kinase GlnL [Luteimonas cucumeris]|uniref:histidine kinase n=1 Tax=Luteimonas cucumeris TaxID=985012 RepID=A0A562LDN6_9GAMM|nr:ATP-binding protein [Luteimonas cucumeris]TWI05760.1 two-component system nitrogen regulation sensor histidine kinase GlnL [Luteimonas cucumeris]
MLPGAPDLDRLTTPLAWTDAGGRIEGSNAAFARWLGVSARRLVDQPLVALETDGDVLRRALSADATATMPAEPLRLRRIALAWLGGEPRFADAWLTRDEEGGGWLLEAHPVDEFPGQDPAIALPGALSAALKGLAHELRNPLAGLKGAAQLLARRSHDAGGLADENSRELTGLIESEVERLTQLLDRLLSPTPPAAHAPLNIHATLERVLRLAESDAGWAVRLLRDYDPSLPELHGDADRLTQATWNLVRNAIEAGAANITLRTRAEHGVRIGDVLHPLVLRLEIVDDGRGVPEDLTERLFLPLVSGRADGSGLGLALAQQVAREHGGSLTYRSRAGHTVFTVLLPLRVEEEVGDGQQ